MKISLAELYRFQTQLETFEKFPLTNKKEFDKVAVEVLTVEELMLDEKVEITFSPATEEVFKFFNKETAEPLVEEEETEEEVEEEAVKTEEEKKVEGRTFSSPRKFSPVPPLAKDDI